MCAMMRPTAPHCITHHSKMHLHRTAVCIKAMNTQAQLTSSQFLQSIQKEPLFCKHLKDSPASHLLLDCHMLLHETVSAVHPLLATATKVSDTEGLFLRHSKDGSSALRVQTLTSPSHLVDWCHHTVAVAPGYCYTKSSLFTPDTSCTPHLELEMGAAAGKQQLLMYINMDPRLSLELHPEYLERYYTSAPPGAERSWMQLDAAAQVLPGFTRFTSPSLHVRAFSSSAILYNVALDPDSTSAAQQVLEEAVKIWLAWSKQPSAAGAADGSGADPPRQELEELAARSAAWRQFPRREASAGFMKAAFGEEVMEDYWDSMAGAERVRLA